jgi:hypothetical protein
VEGSDAEATAAHRRFLAFKWSVYGLLALDMVLFAVGQTLVEARDSLAWLSLLLLFDWETASRHRAGSLAVRGAHLARALAYVVIVQSAVEYSGTAYRSLYGPVDAWNAWTWIAITALLEVEVRLQDSRYGHRVWALRNGTKALLYGSLFVFAGLWAVDRAWLDAFDATLWILCFFVIELNLFGLAPEPGGTNSDRSETMAEVGSTQGRER